MIITRTCILDGIERDLDLDVTEDQMEAYLNRRLKVQDAFPRLSIGEREFIKSGITPEIWEEKFGRRDDDYE